jgi:uncharacterized protein (TIGR03437 family)
MFFKTLHPHPSSTNRFFGTRQLMMQARIKFILAALLVLVGGATISLRFEAIFAAQSPGNNVATVSAATFKPLVAPDSVAASFGQGLATGTEVGSTLPLPTTLLGTTVSVRDALGVSRPAPLLFVSPGQINHLIPAGTAPGAATITVQSGNGQTSTGTVQVTQVAPGIFTANQSGIGVPAGSALRVRNNVQTSELVTMVADGRFIARPIDLGPDTDRVFLILFLTGLRNAPNTDGNNGNGSAENVRVLVGGALQSSTFAGAQGTFAGLDQVNVEIPRSLLDPTIPGSRQINVSVKVPGFADSNEVEIALAPFSGSPLAINSVESDPSVLANQVIRINGSGISPIAANNRVSFGEGSGDVRPGEVIAATPTQLTVQVPFGANTGRISLNSNGNTGTSERPLPVRTSLSATLRDTDGQPISPTIGARVCFPSCSSGNQVATVQPGGWVVLPDPPAGPRRIFVIETPVQNGSLTFNRTTVSSQIVADRDNQLPQQVYLQNVSGPSAVIGSPGFAPSRNRSNAVAPETNLTIDDFTFVVPANAQATFPDGSRSGSVTLTPVKNSLTPVPMPPGVFSSAVVQISPFGIRLAPGGKLIFPNRDNLPPSPQPSLYKYDLPSASFVDTGVKASLSEDGKFFTTPDGSITETSIYFVAVQQQTTTIVGRVLESDGKAVRGAIVTARGRNAVTDGNGGYSLPEVPTGQIATSSVSSTPRTRSQAQTGLIVSSSYLRPSGRTDTVMQTVNNPGVGGVTDLPPFMLPPANSNRPPTVTVPQFLTIYAMEIQDESVVVTELDAGQTITNVSISGADFATLNNQGNGLYGLHLTPKVGDEGERNLTVLATDSAGGMTTATINLTVYPLPTANAQALQTPGGTSLPITLTGSDAAGLPLTFAIVTQPTNGSLSGTPPALTYTPQRGGNDSFTFKVSNGIVESVPATVTITVVNPVPILSSLLPDSTTTINGTFELRVLGSRFVPGAVITFNGQAKQTNFITGTELTATINGSDIAQAGVAQVAVVNPSPGGGTSNEMTFLIRNPEPVLTGLNPSSALAGGSAFTLVITGSGFAPGSVVLWNGSPRETSFFGSSELGASIPASDIAVAGTATVKVLNPEPGGGESNARTFTINSSGPTITQLSPNSVPVNLVLPQQQPGLAPTIITITGTNFVAASVARLNGSNRPTTFINSTQLQMELLDSDKTIGTTFTVTVFNPPPGGGVSNGLPLTITNPVPSITSVTNNDEVAVQVGDGDTQLFVFGNNFVTNSVVRINGNNRATTFVNSQELRVVALASDLTVAGNLQITVFNPAPGGGVSNIGTEPVLNRVPVLSSISPTTTTAGGNAFSLQVNGSNFINGSVVRFNGSDRPTTFVNSSQLTATISALDIGAAGTATITVFTPAPGGGTSGGQTLTINNPLPVLTSISPSTVIAGGVAFVLQADGSGFNINSVILVNGVSRTTNFISGNTLTATVTASEIAVAGTASITVFNPAPGGGTSAAQTLTINNPVPTLNLITPSVVAAGGADFVLQADGSGFNASSIVRFNGSNRTTTFVNSGRVTATITAADIAAAGTANITVLNPSPGGGTSAAQLLTINNALPVTSSINPTMVTAGGADTPITVNGSNFISGGTVQINGFDRPTIFVNSGQVTATIFAFDIATAGTRSITYVNPSPGGGASNAQTLTINNPIPDQFSLNPNVVIAGSNGIQVLVNGAGFNSSTVIRLNGSNRTTNFNNAGQVTVILPASDLTTAGTANITAFNPSPGGGVSNTLIFTILNPGPSITSLNPPTFTAGGQSFVLQVNGSGFNASTIVRFNGSDRPTTLVNSGQVTAMISSADIAVAGSAAITVFNPGPGGGETGQVVTINNPVPVLTSINPSSVNAGGADFVLQANGSNFNASTIVLFNGSDRTTTLVNSGQVTAVISSADIAAAGTASITVLNPEPGGGESAAQSLMINNPVPTLSLIIPSTVSSGGADFVLQANGSGFIASSIVRFNGSNRTTTFVNSGQITATITAADIATAGTANITVFNPGPGGGTSAGQTLTINNPLPVTSSINPTMVTAGGADTGITVNGSNFVSGGIVRFNGADRPTIFVNSGQVTATILAADIAAAGSANITYVNPSPGGGTSNAQTLTINNPVPTLTQLNPTGAVVGSGDVQILVDGSNFNASTVIRFNGSARTTNFGNVGQVTVLIPASDLTTAGTASITAFNPSPGGGVSNSLTFTIFNPMPVLSSINPSSVNAGGMAFMLQANGSGFNASSVVRFNGSDRTTTFVNSGQVTAMISADDISEGGSASITVFNPSPGGGTSGAQTLTINNTTPVLSSLSPNTVLIEPPASSFAQTDILINGSGFLPNSVARINGSDRTTGYISPNQLVMDLEPSDKEVAGTFTVTVFNPGSGLSNGLTLTVANTVPAISSFSNIPGGGPNIPSDSQAFVLGISGSGFVPNSVVRVNGSDRVTTYHASNNLDAQITNEDVEVNGQLSITVFNPTPGGGTSNTMVIIVGDPPVITSLYPMVVDANQQDDVFVTVFGSNIDADNATVTFAGMPVTTFNGEGTLIAVITLEMTKTNQAGTIIVTNPNGLSDSFDSFTIQALTPILENRDPSSVIAGSGDFTLSINSGAEYTTRTVVRWDDADGSADPIELSTTYISSGELMAAVPGSLVTAPAVDPPVIIDLRTPPPTNALASEFSTGLPFFIDSGSAFGLTSRYPSDGSPSRSRMQQGQLSDGRLITTGGRNTFGGRMSFAIMSLAETFDPSTNAWTRIANMIFPREDHTLTVLANGTYDNRYAGEAIVIGGRGLKLLEKDRLLASRTAEIYDPSTNTWRRLADLQFPHLQHTTTRLNDGRLLVVGGMDEKAQVNGAVELYDPNENRWTTVASLATPRAGHRSVLLEDGRVAIIGGSNKDGALTSIEIYDPQTNTWSDGGLMQQSRAEHTATRLKDSGILIVGGDSLAARSSAEIYYPQTRQSSFIAAPGSGRAEHSATLLADGSVLVTGGRAGNGELQAEGEIFNPSTMRWQRTTNMEIPRADHVTSQLKDGRVIVTGSGFSPQRRSSFEVYNPTPISN